MEDGEGEDSGGEGERFPLPPELALADDLTHLARTAAGEGPFPFDGEAPFERLFEDLTRALHRRQARHVLLAGERGVAKGTLVAELARRAAARVIPSLADRHFLRLDCRHLTSAEGGGSLPGVFSAVAGHPELVLVLDGLGSLLCAERAADCRTLLLSALPQIRCRVIVLVTPRECQDLLAGDGDLADCFSRLDVAEPDPEVAIKLLRRLTHGLEVQYGVGIDDVAIRQAVLLTASYVLNDQLPSKALKVLHRACDDLDYERAHQGGTRGRVSADDIVRVVAEKTGVPEGTLRGIADGPDFEISLRQFILGQDHAVREVSTELGLIKAGMTDPGKPASVMLFLGLTGTGKTELAKALARLYSTSGRLRTYALGNCVEPHSVSTIIGVPPGYVGHDKGGPLVNELNADPYGVFLLDEADKAHPDVLQPFLNLFDEGWVTDQRGVRAYGDRAIFILTTNVGQRMIAEMAEQGKTPEEIRERMKEVLAQIRHPKAERPVFTPEFLARLKRIIVFAPLDGVAMEGITRKQLGELRQAWADRRDKTLVVPEDLTRHVALAAQHLNEKSRGKEGGRIVRKLIADWVEAPLQRALSARPAEYRACARVRLEQVRLEEGIPAEPPAAPTVRVHFDREGAGEEPGGNGTAPDLEAPAIVPAVG
jgi:ATP-dependent Clp protease ATP-binding subunit ClpA